MELFAVIREAPSAAWSDAALALIPTGSGGLELALDEGFGEGVPSIVLSPAMARHLAERLTAWADMQGGDA